MANLPGTPMPGPQPPMPALPGSGPIPKPSPLPASWTDLHRIIGLILDLYAVNPVEAASVADFAQSKLNAIREGK